MKQTFTMGAFGIIKDDQNRVLMGLRNDLKVRGLPGGCVENGEAPRNAVVREIKEETGFDVEMIRLVGMRMKPEENDLRIAFECNIIGGQKAINEETDDIQFFGIDEMPENTLPRHIERIKDFFTNKEVIMKIHTGKSPSSLSCSLREEE